MTFQLNQILGSRNEDEKTYKDIKNSTFKYTLHCNMCAWNSSFYEATGSIYLDSGKMLCPFCRNREIMWQKSLI